SLNGAGTVATFTPANSLAPGTTYIATISGATDAAGQAMLGPYTYTFVTSKAFEAGGSCPCALWPDVAPSGFSDVTDGTPVELGVRFTASQDGSISGIRFYKVPDNTGTHTGSLWSSTGTLLATGTFTNESSQGWEELDFSSPVAVTAGTTYVASYHTSAAHYADTPSGLASAVTSGPLTALASGGVYAYGSSRAFSPYRPNPPGCPVARACPTPPGTSAPVEFGVAPARRAPAN